MIFCFSAEALVCLMPSLRPSSIDRADAVLGGGDQPHGQEPYGERQLGGVEDGAGGERDLVPARAAPDLGPGAEPRTFGAAAERADEAPGPAQLLDHRPAPLL